jgi:hypothetical protein
VGRVDHQAASERVVPSPTGLARSRDTSALPGPVSFVPGRAQAGPFWSCFGPAQIAQPRWPGIAISKSYPPHGPKDSHSSEKPRSCRHYYPAISLKPHPPFPPNSSTLASPLSLRWRRRRRPRAGSCSASSSCAASPSR